MKVMKGLKRMAGVASGALAIGVMTFGVLTGCSKETPSDALREGIAREKINLTNLEKGVYKVYLYEPESERPTSGHICCIAPSMMGARDRRGFEIVSFLPSESEDMTIAFLANSYAVHVLSSRGYINDDVLGDGLYECLGIVNLGTERKLFFRELDDGEALCVNVYLDKKKKNSVDKEEFVAIPGRSFRMCRTEVTQAQWEAVMGNNPSHFKGPDNPVGSVSWNDCQEFIKRLNAKTGKNFRLPTEEEWEYCCRAGGTGDWGKRKNGQDGPLDAMGWYDKNSCRMTHPVAQKEPNAWGLYDMHGNVWEWTSTADGGDRVCRGGGWDDGSRGCAAGCRFWFSPVCCDFYLGFRLVSEDL